MQMCHESHTLCYLCAQYLLHVTIAWVSQVFIPPCTSNPDSQKGVEYAICQNRTAVSGPLRHPGETTRVTGDQNTARRPGGLSIAAGRNMDKLRSRDPQPGKSDD